MNASGKQGMTYSKAEYEKQAQDAIDRDAPLWVIRGLLENAKDAGS